MAKKADARTFNINIVGLSGTEKEKGVTGVGKSCLCNRFMCPLADDYHVEHISVLSQSDFGGRVINNDHFLYWGEITKTDEGIDHTFHVVEQTEFVDDVSFQPFKTGKHEPYLKRCTATKVQSAEKLMYICKEQLGMETDSAYEQKLMQDGKLSIDGFMVVFDVSVVQNRPIERQVEFVVQVLNALQKIKKPVVLATTKHDEADERYVKEAERLITRKDFKVAIPIIETSAHENVNVELAFMTLAHLIDKTKARAKIVPFADANRARKDILDVATNAYKKLLNSQVTDPKSIWTSWKKRFQRESDYVHYVELFGTEKARWHFYRHTKHLREEQIRHQELNYLETLPEILHHFLPDLETIGDRSWTACQNYIHWHDDKTLFFVEVSTEGQTWRESDLVDNVDEKRMPFDLLKSSEAENRFRNHVNALQEEHRKLELKKKLKACLEETKHVKPGKPLSETYVYFIGKECYIGLNDRERCEVYEQHQVDIRQRAKLEFQELMWEKSEVFTGLNPSARLTQEDLKVITNALQNDPRYTILDRLDEDRKVMILNHLGFIQCPSKERCYFRESCVETQVQKVLAARAIKPDISLVSSENFDGGEKLLNLVLLGKDGLAQELNQEIRNMCVEDEYRYENVLYSLDYRPIDRDVSLEQHSFATPTFKPHGCMCVYSSSQTLEYVRSSLEQTLLSDLAKEDGHTLDGMPIVIIQALNPECSDKEIETLREQGLQLARRLQYKFIDIPLDKEDLDDSQQFYVCQIEQALHSIIEFHTRSLIPTHQDSNCSQPDMRIAMCMMCGDPFSIEFPLSPLLNNDCCRVLSEDNSQLVVETYLDDTKRKIEVSVMSYHGANAKRSGPFHGYILVYSAKRRASLATMKAFSTSLHSPPILVLAVTNCMGATMFFTDEYSQTLISIGNSVAEMLKAHFITTTSNFQQQTTVYMPFFKETWDKREETESLFISAPEHPVVVDHVPSIDRRPPAPLPKPYEVYQPTKSSTSNSQSTEDSEPLYDHLVFPGGNQYQSDSEQDRASSTSPPPIHPLTDYEIISSVAAQTNGEHLIRPSQVKNRRNKFSGPDDDEGFQEQYREQYRKSYPAADSEALQLPSIFSVDYTEAKLQSPYHMKKSSSMKDELEAGFLEFPMYETASPRPEETTMWTENNLYRSYKTGRTGTGRLEPRPLNRKYFEPVAKVISRNLTNVGTASLSSSSSSGGRVQAPLAVPEPIEIADYGTVKDALLKSMPESDYTLVEDALPAGKVHRIKSARKKEHKGGTDSEDSEFSSLERDRKVGFHSKVNRRPTPHKKKHKQRSQDSHSTLDQAEERGHLAVQGGSFERVRSNSPSEGSEGTGDELRVRRKPRSLRKKCRSPTMDSSTCTISPPMSDSDNVNSPPNRLDDENPYETIVPRDYGAGTITKYALTTDDGDDLADSGHWKDRFHMKIKLRDSDRQRLLNTDRQRRKEEKRRQKEEERKQKEQQKLQKKIKKKDGKVSSISQSGPILDDFPMSEKNENVPMFVELCVLFIEIEGITAEGIYRVPGNKAQVDLLLSKFQEDSYVDIKTLDIQVNAVATALKGFFNDLSEPILPCSLYSELTEASGVADKSSRLLALRGVLKKLPTINYDVLKYLITHINRISKHHETNNMDSKNLARCWWPTLIRMEFQSFGEMSYMSRIPVDILQTLIDQCRFFFHGENEV